MDFHRPGLIDNDCLLIVSGTFSKAGNIESILVPAVRSISQTWQPVIPTLSNVVSPVLSKAIQGTPKGKEDMSGENHRMSKAVHSDDGKSAMAISNQDQINDDLEKACENKTELIHTEVNEESKKSKVNIPNGLPGLQAVTPVAETKIYIVETESVPFGDSDTEKKNTAQFSGGNSVNADESPVLERSDDPFNLEQSTSTGQSPPLTRDLPVTEV